MLLLAVYSLSQWSLMREMARRLRARERGVGVIWTGSATVAAVQVAQAQAEALGARFIVRESFDALADTGMSQPSLSERPHWFKPEPDALSPDHPYRELVRRQIGGAQKLLDQHPAEALLVCEDGPGGDNALIAVARSRRLPVLVVPFGVGESHDYDIFLEDKHCEGNLNFLPDGALGDYIRQRASHWIRTTPYGDVLLFPPEFLVARILEGLDIPQPWVVHGGLADKLAVESPAMDRHYQREGVPALKRVQTGTVYCDALYDALHSNTIYDQAHRACSPIRADRTSLLISLPPSYHGQRAPLSEHPTYEAMCEAMMALFASVPNLACTISIHPNSSDLARQALLSTGAQVTQEWLVSLIPRHDLFLTTYSSTIRWAIASHKPVLNYDMYGFGTPTYANLAGVQTHRHLASLSAALRVLCSDTTAYQQSARHQAAAAADWGTLDGKNFERLLAEIDKLCSR
jgi:hypothetical protein